MENYSKAKKKLSLFNSSFQIRCLCSIKKGNIWIIQIGNLIWMHYNYLNELHKTCDLLNWYCFYRLWISLILHTQLNFYHNWTISSVIQMYNLDFWAFFFSKIVHTILASMRSKFNWIISIYISRLKNNR